MASLSVEPAGPEDSIIVAQFETPYTEDAVEAWLEREHEYRFLAVRTETLEGTPSPRLAVCFFLIPVDCALCNTSRVPHTSLLYA
jgi:hypothetical protein